MSGAVVFGAYPPPPAGKSAYELAVDNGFVGTLEEWLASLVGPPGPTNDQFPEGTVLPLRADWQAEWVWFILRDAGTGEVIDFYDKDGLPA